MRGYWGIGCENMKTGMNYGSLHRSAQSFGASFIFLIGKRFKRQSSDVLNSWKHIPLYEYDSFDDFNKHRPFDCKPIGVEITKNSIPIKEFEHPERAIYLLGAEDSGLTKNAMNKCQNIIQIPGDYCLNVANAGTIVMFDRINKSNTR